MDLTHIYFAQYNKTKLELEILQSLGGLYDGLAFYPLPWS